MTTPIRGGGRVVPEMPHLDPLMMMVLQIDCRYTNFLHKTAKIAIRSEHK